MTIYFHVTTKSAWEKIRQEGLIPQVGKRSQKLGELIPAIFLFTSETAMQDEICNWLGDEFEEDEPLVALQIHLPPNLKSYIDSSCEYEAKCLEPIPPKYIKMFKTDL